MRKQKRRTGKGIWAPSKDLCFSHSIEKKKGVERTENATENKSITENVVEDEEEDG